MQTLEDLRGPCPLATGQAWRMAALPGAGPCISAATLGQQDLLSRPTENHQVPGYCS